jgi:hypothetical protein
MDVGKLLAVGGCSFITAFFVTLLVVAVALIVSVVRG